MVAVCAISLHHVFFNVIGLFKQEYSDNLKNTLYWLLFVKIIPKEALNYITYIHVLVKHRWFCFDHIINAWSMDIGIYLRNSETRILQLTLRNNCKFCIVFEIDIKQYYNEYSLIVLQENVGSFLFVFNCTLTFHWEPRIWQIIRETKTGRQNRQWYYFVCKKRQG